MTKQKRKPKSKSLQPKKKKADAIALLNKYTDEEKNLIKDYAKKYKNKPQALGYHFEKDEDGNLVKSVRGKEDLLVAYSTATAGTAQDNLAGQLINQTIAASLDPTVVLDSQNGGMAFNAILEAMAEFTPRDGIEGMLVAQIVSVHNQAMHCLFKANVSIDNVNTAESYRKQAASFMNLFTKQMEALKRYRGKAQQKVTVEHVNVNQGGQAIVGNVNNQGGENEGK
jgi:hypothetical protein